MRYGFKNAEEVKETSLKYNLHSWSVQGKLNPAVVEKAEGIYYYTADGKKMADMSSQLVNLNVGYGNKDIIDAIKEQAEKLAYISPATLSTAVQACRDGRKGSSEEYGQGILHLRRRRR